MHVEIEEGGLVYKATIEYRDDNVKQKKTDGKKIVA